MTPLSVKLDTADFDSLLAIARARLPALAKQWTDYNYHDPGIMLVELVAWLADSQIYSLARNRQDERLGFLRLLGSRARGARPARGMVFPPVTPDDVIPIDYGGVLKPARGGAPRMEAAARITLLPVAIRRIAAGADQRDVTDINAQTRAAFSAFGAEGDGALRIEVAVGTVPAGTGPVLLSLGFRLACNAPDATVQRFGRVGAYAADGTPLRRTRDTTFGLQRSGVMVFQLDSAALAQPIELRPEGGYALNPSLLQIVPNALPVVQCASLRFTDVVGNGRPGQTIEIAPSALFDADEEVDERHWRLVDGAAALAVDSQFVTDPQDRWRAGLLDEAEPGVRRYAVTVAADGSRIALRFGNGVNGRCLGQSERPEITLRLSCGLAGSVISPTDWVMQPGGTRWRNADPIAGGSDAQGADEALGTLRERLAVQRPLATSPQIADAALALPPALGVKRAQVVEGWERGRRKPATAATRTLLAGGAAPGEEDAAWLAAIRRRLAPRIAVGERVLVAAPDYRRFTLALAIVATRGSDPATVAAAVKKAIGARFDPVANPWPFGRDVSATAIAGWARRVEGVARVASVTLTPADGGATGAMLAVAPDALPLLISTPTVTATRAMP
jgi:hypothetical protein